MLMISYKLAWYKYVLDVWYHQDRMDEDIANQIVEQTEED